MSACLDRPENACDLGTGAITAIPTEAGCLEQISVRARTAGVWRDLEVGAVLHGSPVEGGMILDLEAEPPVEGFALMIRGVPGGVMQQQGYQSWSFSGAIEIPRAEARREAPKFAAAEDGDPLREETGTSYASVVVGGEGPAFVAGALSAHIATTGFRVRRGADGNTVEIVYGALGEALPAGPDGKVHSERIYVGSGSEASSALERLTERVRAESSRPLTPHAPLGGWYSWNSKFDQIDEAYILAHVGVVSERLAPVGLPLVEIDDGWEVAWGDWRPNARFPSGMKALADAITRRGLVAGVWLAPFLVAVDSDVGRAIDPSLLVKDRTGAPLIHRPGGNSGRYYVLDGSQPKAMEIATRPLRELFLAGYRFFKLDFLYAGALPGLRAHAEMTGNQALALGLSELRRAVGEGSIINACGAPILPSIGFADSLRIGSDTAFGGVPISVAFVASAARSLAARAHLSPLVWLDADQAQLRDPLDLATARISAVVAAMAGPAYALGDDLTALPETRLDLALSPEVIDLSGADGAATPDDPLESPAQEIVGNPLIDALGAGERGTSAPPPSRFRIRGRQGVERTIAIDWSRAGLSISPGIAPEASR